jgi:thiamine pyrophosphate-dependent acetolactate synthase large subunit-like protein
VKRAEVADTRRYQPTQAAPSAAQIDGLRTLLAGAQKPLLLLGGGTWTDAACADVQRFAEANALPVACAFRFQDLLDNEHPHYVGDVGIGINPKLAARVKEADVLIAFGPRLGEMTTSGYSLLASPVPQQRLVHIHPDPQELGSVYQAELMIAGGAPQTARMLAAMAPVDAAVADAWRHTVEEAKAELRAWQEQPPIFKDGSAPLDLWQLVQDLQSALPHDTIVTNGAGNYATWAHRFWRYGAMRTQLAPTSGYSLLTSPVPKQRLVHIHPDPQELGSVYQAELMIAGGAPETARMLAAMEPVDASAWRHTVEEAKAELRAWQAEPPVFAGANLSNPAPLNLWQLVQDLQAALPRDTIITNGAGNYATWAHRFWRYGAMRTQLAPTSGAMGYGVPAGVAAKIVDPSRTVVTFAGDGEFMMTGQELATAVQYRAGLILIVFNNSMFGTIRMHQEREYPGRVSGTELHNPDFAALAQAYGGHGEVVEKTADFAPALQRAVAFTNEQKLPAVIELRYDGNLITPGATLETIRKNAEAAKKK